jgi:hypothetical protein
MLARTKRTQPNLDPFLWKTNENVGARPARIMVMAFPFDPTGKTPDATQPQPNWRKALHCATDNYGLFF